MTRAIRMPRFVVDPRGTATDTRVVPPHAIEIRGPSAALKDDHRAAGADKNEHEEDA